MVTYYRDVLPIFQQHCISCHRPGQIAPMSFVTYRETALGRRHQACGRDSQDATVVGRLSRPTWTGTQSLAEKVETIIQWVEGGALAGNANEAPPPSYPEQRLLRPGQNPKDR